MNCIELMRLFVFFFCDDTDLAKLIMFFLQSHDVETENSVMLDSTINQMASIGERSNSIFFLVFFFFLLTSLPLDTAFLNPDGVTGFGTPWEIIFQTPYVIRTKGGNINGYSALFSFISELQLGVTMLFNNVLDESSFAEAAYETLIPAFIQVCPFFFFSSTFFGVVVVVNLLLLLRL
jgi:hypothetical protein